ncbi:MAG TPA: hypothetical protein DCZ97_12520 [Syntrophus sp. (in: bacteria)]|nr:hypothetical protein [Syntrophus sp. (in: bacteria)]
MLAVEVYPSGSRPHFNSALMNDAVFKFKRYEDSSLSYTGINKHEGEDIGLYDTVLSTKSKRHRA